MKRKYDLTYYVYIENINKHIIDTYNVLTDAIIDEIKEEIKKNKSLDKDIFEHIVARIMAYHYCYKSEYELLLTSAPAYINSNHLVLLNMEHDKYLKDFEMPPYKISVPLTLAEKIYAYDQIMLNWGIFIDYLWENLKGK